MEAWHLKDGVGRPMRLEVAAGPEGLLSPCWALSELSPGPRGNGLREACLFRASPPHRVVSLGLLREPFSKWLPRQAPSNAWPRYSPSTGGPEGT